MVKKSNKKVVTKAKVSVGKLKNAAGKGIKKVKTSVDKKLEGKRKKHVLLIILLSIMIFIATCGLAFTVYIIAASPEFKVEELYKTSSSILYDTENNVIAELGVQKRDNVTYDELSDVLVDAIVATEDSKFFQHSGIDLLRFGKAVFGQLLGHSDAGGGSTLTMQIVKNTYNGTVSSGIRGIVRKFTDIYMAVFKVEKAYTKQEILEFYVNQPFLGSNSYGVGQASETYFGKTVSELNLSEAATIAGLFQAPGAYDPYIYPEKAENRRNIVLNLMLRHGYITKEEAETAKAIPLKSLLVGRSAFTVEYQGFVDTVVAEVIKKTKLDPATTSMKIYTTMVKSKQDVVNNLYNGTLGYKWKNDVVQSGIAVTDVDDGSIVAIGTGRNKTGERTYNYATSIHRHPGSTAKPIFDYGPAIEYLGWGTGQTIIDDVYTYTGGTSINNVDRGYNGIMTIKTALAKSRNIPALQAFQANTQENIYEFVTNLGIKPELHNGEIYESSSIGAFDGVSPLELSAAYGAFSRGGYYIEPYSFTKIVYNDTDETYTYTPTKSKAMSEETAYMINQILHYAVTSGSISTGSVSGTDLASKTGTSSVPNETVKNLGLSYSAIRDSWQVTYSPDYAIAFWYGYDTITKEHYLTTNEGWSARKAIATQLTKNIMKKNSRWTKPDGVITVDIELETNPVQLASENTPDNLRSTEYYKKGTEPTEVSTRFNKLENVSNLTYTSTNNLITLTWSPIETPDAIDPTWLQDYFNTGYKPWSDKYYQRRLEYNAANIGTLQYSIYLKNSDGSLSYVGSTPNSSFTTTLTNASSATFVVKSTYSIFTYNASSGTEITARITSPVTDGGTTPDDTDDNTNITNP